MRRIGLARPLLGGLLILLAVVGVSRSRQLSPVYDEIAHIAAGYAYVTAGDYRFNPEHPPLVKLLAGLAVATLPVSDVRESRAFAAGDQWALGQALLEHPAPAPWAVIDRARVPSILLGVLGGWLLFRLVSVVTGQAAAFLALILYVGHPEITGHMTIVATDAPLMTFGLGAVLMAIKVRRRVSPGRVAWLGAYLAAAHLAKFSAVLLWPMVLAPLLWPGPGRLGPRQVAGVVGAALGLAVVLGLLVYQGPRALWLYPRGFLLAFTRDLADPDFSFYLLGNYSTRGFWSYFAAATVLKSPIPLLLLYAWGLGSLLVDRPGRDETLAVLLPGAAWLLLTSLLAANIASRYVLPGLPFFLAMAARVARGGRRWLPVVALTLASGHAVSGARATDAIGYTNALVPPGHELAYLDMGCIDWGQGLRLLDRQLAELPGRGPVVVLYRSPLSVAGVIRSRRIVQVAPEATFDAGGGVRPGRYAVSTQLLLRVPGLRDRLARSCVVEAGLGPSMVLLCCPPCGPAAREDAVLRIPLSLPPARGTEAKAPPAGR